MTWTTYHFLMFCSLVLVLVALRPVLRRIRRSRLEKADFPSAWKRILEARVFLYKFLPDNIKSQLHGRINVFLSEKRFEGCGGLEVTEEIRVTIAALACMLLLNRRTDYYPRLKSILVYPHSYVAEDVSAIGNAGVHGMSFRSGESWAAGAIVIAWRDLKEEVGEYTTGHNVVLHEFAHQLDQENGSVADGIPLLPCSSRYAGWARVMGSEFRKFKDKVERDEVDVLDEYGARNEAEFFAVATETFFELPQELKMEHPALYDELKGLYGVDPGAWQA